MPVGFRQVFVSALAVRLLFLLAYAIWYPEQWTQPGFGGSEMGNIARNLFEGRGYSSPFSADSEPTAWFPPLVPALWAGVMTLLGQASGLTEFVIVLLQAIAGSLAVALYVEIFRRVAPAAPELITHLFTAAVLFWPESLLRVVFLWYYVWQELSIAALVWFGLRWWERPTTRSAVMLGITGGISALINISPIPVFLQALAAPAFRSLDRGVLRRACLGGLVAFLIVTPWIVRNRLVFGHFVPLRGNFGVELLQGNNPDGAVRRSPAALLPYHSPEEYERYRALGEVEYNRDAFRRAMAWMAENPRRAAVKVAQRGYVVWMTDLTDRWSRDGRPWWQGRYSFVLQAITLLSALATLAAALIGVWRVGFRGIPRRWLIFAPLLATIPYYFTRVDDSYVAFIRLWLLLIAAVCVSVRTRITLNEELQVYSTFR
jgi:hypothetical protein